MKQALQVVARRRLRLALAATVLLALAIESAINPKVLPLMGALVAMYAGHLLSPALYILAPITSVLPADVTDTMTKWLSSLVN